MSRPGFDAGFGWPALAVALMFGIGMLGPRAPLESARPGELWSDMSAPAAERRVRARLWQDPLAAVEAKRKEPGALDATCAPRIEAPGALVLAVLLPGRPYPEAVEKRIRYRYAVIGALMARGYVPSDGEWLAWFAMPPCPRGPEGCAARDPWTGGASEGGRSSPPPRGVGAGPGVESDPVDDAAQVAVSLAPGASTADPPSDPFTGPTNSEERPNAPGPARVAEVHDRVIVPFESFRREPGYRETDCSKVGKEPREVFLLWINEEHLRESPLSVLCHLLDCVIAAPSDDPRVRHRGAVIGPSESDVLVRMVDEALELRSRGGCTPADSCQQGFTTIYSPWATISERQLREQTRLVALATGQATNCNPDFPYLGHCFQIERTIGTDDVLAKLLIKELRLRGVDIEDDEDLIAIVAEGDTAYGRSLPALFHREGEDDVPGNVRWYTYLRGVDGWTPHGSARSRSETDKGSAEERRPTYEKLLPEPMQERCEGRSQLDYIRRLVEKLGRDTDLGAEKGRLKAIGVLGSDVYDKLLLLRALRQAFPSAIYFTTDLDMRLFHPSERPWTRNMIVASHFGLELGGQMHLRGRLAPFRGSYQTSAFRATLMALCDAHQAPKPTGRVYEIGRTGPYDLSVQGRKVSPSEALYPISPRNHSILRQPLFWFLGAVILVCGLFLVSLAVRSWSGVPSKSSGTVGEWAQLRESMLHGMGLVFGVPLLFLILIVVPDSLRADGEPFELIEGISVWPTTLIRVLAAVVGILLILRVVRGLDESLEQIRNAHGLDAAPRRDTIAAPAWLPKWLHFLPYELLHRKWRDACCIIGWEPESDAVKAQQIWSAYASRAGARERWVRTLGLLPIYVAFTASAFGLLGPPATPYRGWVSAASYGVVLALTILVVDLLILLVWDATRLCERFIRNLNAHPIRFSNGVVGKFLDEGRPAAKKPSSSKKKGARPKTSKAITSAAIAYLSPLIGIRIVARRTAAVQRTIYFPFGILLLLILARHPLTDNWSFSVPVALAVGIGLAVTLYSLVTLRRSAGAFRRKQIDLLRGDMIAAAHRGELSEEDRWRVESVIEEMKGIREGAYGGPWKSPVIGALLLPAGGVGIYQALAALLGGG